MANYILKLTLQSEATFGRGDGVAGLVDTEIEHDERGLPYLHGRGVKGLFTAQCADLLGALEQSAAHSKFKNAATRLFGDGGSDLKSIGVLSFGHARLPQDLRAAVNAVKPNDLSRTDVVEALTTIRRQTMIDATKGAAKEDTLRAIRVLMRGLEFHAHITVDRDLDSIEQALLGACVQAIRRVGSQRARGLGRVRTELVDENGNSLTEPWMTLFAQEVQA